VFGPLPRDYSYHMPAKARRVALRSASRASSRTASSSWPRCPSSTRRRQRACASSSVDLGSPRRALVVLADANPILWKSMRNYTGVTVRSAQDLCAYDVIAGGLVIAEEEALSKLADRVGAKADDNSDANSDANSDGGAA
jgi:large subunit ribosomal protein L4